MQKKKSIHHIMIEGCRFGTQLFYDLNTNHIGIGTYYNYQNQNLNKTKEYKKNYYKNNKNKIKNKVKQYNENNKEKVKKYQKQYRKDNRDLNITVFGSKEHKIKLSCIQQNINIENWDGFLTDQKYCYKFNNSCKESNRNKYDRKCFICDKDEIENGQRLSVHHINMDKSQGCNNKQWKLVPLCQSCHSKSHNKLWEYRLKYLLNNI